MKLLANEIYGPSNHFWYEKDVMKEHEYGFIFNHNQDWIEEIAEQITLDIASTEENPYDTTYWYFGKTVEDMLLMLRYREHEFIIQINVKDFDFALHTDEIQAWKKRLITVLQGE